MADASPTPPGPDSDSLSLTQQISALLADLPGLVGDRVHLLSLELKRATRSLAQMLALALLASILVATAWLALWIGIGAALIKGGMSWPWACVVVMVVNLAVAAWAALRLKGLAPLLALPATLRRMTDADAREREDAASLSRGHRTDDLSASRRAAEELSARRHAAETRREQEPTA